MERLTQLLRDEPSVQDLEISLEDDSQDIRAIFQLLGQFKNLKHVRLIRGEVTELPEDLSMLSLLESLTMSLSHELLANPELELQGLTTLRNLAYLHIPNLELAGLRLVQHMLPTVEVSSGELDEDRADAGVFTSEQIQEVTDAFEKICAYGDSQGRTKAGYKKASFKLRVKKTAQKVRNRSGSIKTEAFNVKAKRLLYHICIQELETVTSFVSQELSELWKSAVHHLDLLLEEALNLSQFPSPRSLSDSLEQGKGRLQSQETETGWVMEKAELLAQIQDLETENKRYLDTIIKHSKSSATHALKSSAPVSPITIKPFGFLSSRQSVSSSSPKALSLKQLKELIEEIYTAKAKNDDRCLEQRLPQDTMAEFLNKHFTKKFGLKSLQSEWSAGVWRAIDNYSSQDNDVAVFGKILCNECEEEFPSVQKQVKYTAEQLLKMYLQNKFPFKDVGEVEEMFKETVRGQVAESEWRHVVGSMYNETDASLLTSLVIEMAEQRIMTPRSAHKQRRMTREELSFHTQLEQSTKHQVSYQDFLKVLLDFQLQGHEQFLETFLKKFKEVDADTNGLINESEFSALTLSLGLHESDQSRLLLIIDPFNHQRISFSQCVSLFTSVSSI